jgi:hypothetical protein
MRRNRLILAIALALSSAAALAIPASAATVLDNCAGETCGNVLVQDTGPSGGKGAVCKYEKNSYDLDFISVRPPWMWGPYSYNTKVEWLYKIMRSTNSGGSWSTYYTSSWQSAMANKNDGASAGDGFSRRYWYAPESPTGWFKVRLTLRWKDSGGNVTGTFKLEYDHYKRLWSSSSDYAMDHCIQDW